MSETKMLVVRLPIDLVDSLKERAAREGRTMVELTKRAVTAYLEEEPPTHD